MQDVSLEEAIQQQIGLGYRDPLEIADKCADLYGGDWVGEQLAANWRDIFAEIARQKIGNERRAAVVSISNIARENRKPSKRELMLTTLFVPKVGYVAFGDATAEDFAAASQYRRRLADGLLRWADYFDEWRALLATQNVKRAKDARGPLPELPSIPPLDHEDDPELGMGA